MPKLSSERHWIVLGCLGAVLVAAAGASPQHSGADTALTEAQRNGILQRVERMPKIDSHVHLWTISGEDQEALVRFLVQHNWRWLDVCTAGMEWPRLQAQMSLARGLNERHKDRVEWATSFNLTNWRDDDWQRSALDTVATNFSQGAVALKVWKEIGMELRDPDGRFVMIDDPRFEPILALVERQHRALVAHLGEPRNCWLPLEEMTTASDRNYFTRNPQYHAFLHKEIPAYEEQLAARDRMIERHPGLRVVFCHLASIEYDTDRLAAWLDRHPAAAVDVAGRLVHLQIQSRDKIRAFLIKYQDRIVYGTDTSLGAGYGTSPAELPDMIARLEQTYSHDTAWLATDAWVEVPRASPTFRARGVELPMSVLRKIYYDNARRWYRGW
jgi:predicted TIM-barrel fold metal-dependent hydrolase